MSQFVRRSILLVASVGLLAPSVHAAAQPSTLDSLNAAHASLVVAKTDQARGELQSLTDRLKAESSPASEELLRQVRYIVVELSTGDVQGAKSELEALIDDVGSNEPNASITSRPGGGGGGHGPSAGGHSPSAGGHNPGAGHNPRPGSPNPGAGHNPRPGSHNPGAGHNPRPGSHNPGAGHNPRPGSHNPGAGHNPGHNPGGHSNHHWPRQPSWWRVISRPVHVAIGMSSYNHGYNYGYQLGHFDGWNNYPYNTSQDPDYAMRSWTFQQGFVAGYTAGYQKGQLGQ